MEYYSQDIKTIIAQFNSEMKKGLDEKAIQPARLKFGKNILKAVNTRSVYFGGYDAKNR